MKKHLILAVALVAAILSACSSDDGVMTKNGDTYIVNTTSIAADVIGFKGTTPLLVHIENDIVVKVEPLENIETPRYFRDVEDSLLGVWIGMPVKEVAESEFSPRLPTMIVSSMFTPILIRLCSAIGRARANMPL